MADGGAAAQAASPNYGGDRGAADGLRTEAAPKEAQGAALGCAPSHNHVAVIRAGAIGE